MQYIAMSVPIMFGIAMFVLYRDLSLDRYINNINVNILFFQVILVEFLIKHSISDDNLYILVLYRVLTQVNKFVPN